MKASKMFLSTLREVPSEAEIPSHILLLRAGMIKKLVSGVYAFMPLGYRSLRKIEDIVRQEMDAAGAQEVLMSALQPAELWQESGRWYAYGPEMWRLKDRNDREFCLGPTHEEIFTDVVRQQVSSYRQLPLNLYQIQTKYRDEARPRFGLIRSREFIMKDAYSFDRDDASLDDSYKAMYAAYEKVFDRCGLKYRAVEADSGAIGGSNSHEFCALSDVGEEEIVYCEHCSMAATAERASFRDEPGAAAEELPLEKKYTPGTKTIEAVAEFLGLAQKQTIKALLLQAFDPEDPDAKIRYIACFIRGDRQLNMTKLVNALGLPEYAVQFADEAAMGSETGCVGGFTGPIGLHDCTIVADTELVNTKNLCAGACEADHHYINVNYGRDYKADIVTDIKLLQAGDPCPVCGAPVKSARGIEVGQVFKLGTKYSVPMHLCYKDENQQEHPVLMGCYGIGVTRTLAAVVEQNHDDNGIIWPITVAPFECEVVPVNDKDDWLMEEADKLYRQLNKDGVDTIIDDRKERPGVKVKDADRIGIPVRNTVGRDAAEGIVEFKERAKADNEKIHVDEAAEKALALIAAK